MENPDIESSINAYLKKKGVPDFINAQNIQKLTNVVKGVIKPKVNPSQGVPSSTQNVAISPAPIQPQNLSMAQVEYLRQMGYITNIQPQNVPVSYAPASQPRKFPVDKLVLSVGSLSIAGAVYWWMHRKEDKDVEGKEVTAKEKEKAKTEVSK